MESQRRFRGLVFSFTMVPVGLFIVLTLLWSIRPLLLPMVIGILLAYLFRPLKTAFRYPWLPNGIRVALIVSALIMALFSSFRFVRSNIPNDQEKLELLVRMKFKLNEKFEKIMGIDKVTGKGNGLYNLVSEDINPLRNQINALLSLSPDQVGAFEEFYKSGLIQEKYYNYFLENGKTRPSIKNSKNTSKVNRETASVTEGSSNSSHEQSFFKVLLGILSVWLLLPISFVFFLLDDGAIPQFFVRMVPNRYFELSLSVLEAVDGAIGKYLRGLSMECGLVGSSLAVGLFLIGASTKVAILIGLMAAFATAIPLVGPVMGLGLSLTYAIIAEEITPVIPGIHLENLVVMVLIVVAIVIALDNLVFQPIVLGSAVNLHPMAVILGIMGGSMLFGLVGVLLAVPTIVITKTIIQNTFRGLKDYRIV